MNVIIDVTEIKKEFFKSYSKALNRLEILIELYSHEVGTDNSGKLHDLIVLHQNLGALTFDHKEFFKDHIQPQP